MERELRLSPVMHRQQTQNLLSLRAHLAGLVHVRDERDQDWEKWTVLRSLYGCVRVL